jgi:hypothetical protein
LIRAAQALTIAEDPSWRPGREQLLLLESALLLRGDEPAAALASLDRFEGTSRTWRRQRAACLERLGRIGDATQEAKQADSSIPLPELDLFLTGVDHFHRKDLGGAVRTFEGVLDLDPTHFPARFAHAVCLLRLHRPVEARIALTACLGQRPLFVASYVLRSEACSRLGAETTAGQDLRRARELDAEQFEWAQGFLR